MGFDPATLQFLLNAEKVGLSLDRILTVGRQKLYMRAAEVARLYTASGRKCTPEAAAELWNREKGFAEPLLRHLGAREVSSLDFSTYEDATIVHDMNQPLDARYHSQFSLVIDGGSLEHIFNYPTAMANCMQAVEPGGHLVVVTPANNLMGHGFYQFSPELLFRVLSPENGYRIKHMLVYESPWNGVWYEVPDPQELGYRLEFSNARPLYLIACAQRTEATVPFRKPPQQSDYVTLWKSDGNAARVAVPAWKKSLPLGLVKLYWRMRPFRPPYYRKLSPRLE